MERSVLARVQTGRVERSTRRKATLPEGARELAEVLEGYGGATVITAVVVVGPLMGYVYMSEDKSEMLGCILAENADAQA
jgi:hypothetical protein